MLADCEQPLSLGSVVLRKMNACLMVCNVHNVQVKASQCYTKYKFRSQEAADRQGGPAIVATQVISDYLTAYDGELLLIKAQNRPVVVYTYSMLFVRQRGLSV